MKRARGQLKEPGLSQLRKNIPNLIEQCEPDEVQRCLFAKGVINKTDNEKVGEGKTASQRMSILLHILLDCGPNSFDTIIECFKEAGYKDVMRNLGFNVKASQPASSGVRGHHVSEDSQHCRDNVTDAIVAEIPVVKPASDEMKTIFDQLDGKNNSIYSLKHKPRGLCVVISNYDFPGHTDLPPLPGYKKDAADLESLFSQLGFNVELFKNQTASEIEAIIDKYMNKNHSKFDCFVLIVLSHGNTGVVSGKDGKKVQIEDKIYSSFDGKNCGSLRGKPKLFFIQACNGENHDEGVTTAASNREPQKVINAIIPKDADMFIATAATCGFVCFVHPVNGSYFIQAIVSIFKDHAKEMDLLRLMTSVNAEIKSELINCKGAEYKQMSEFRTTFSKQLYFFPGLSKE